MNLQLSQKIFKNGVGGGETNEKRQKKKNTEAQKSTRIKEF